MTTAMDTSADAPGAGPEADEDVEAKRHDVAGRVAVARERLVRPPRSDGWFGWFGPLAVTALAAILRFWNLGAPDRITFDETYYVKGGLSLWRFGIERDSVDGADELLLTGTSDIFTNAADYVVHPMVGKWVIGSGMQFFGVSPWSWRFGTAVMGTLMVLAVALIGRRLLGSTLLGCAAALLLAVDGTAIVLSRVALLDGILAAFVVFAFGCLLVDRDRARAVLADRLATTPLTALGRWEGPGPRLGWRPWRIAAGVMLGLALGTKWSGLWFIAAFGLLTVLWDVGARRTAGMTSPLTAMLRRDALPAFASIVGVALLTYLATWGGWFLTSDGWDRQWAAGAETSWPFIPEAIRSLWHYHVSMYQFHSGLSTPHPYESNAWGWLIQARPTAIHYSSAADCGSENCTSAVTAVGNPVIWWAGVGAMLLLVVDWVGRRDWRAGAILCGFAAGWVPWLVLYNDRTVFQFYAVVIAPFVCLALAYALGRVLGPASASTRRRTVGAAAAGAFVVSAVLAAAFFYPVWSAEPISFAEWGERMWFRSWI